MTRDQEVLEGVETRRVLVFLVTAFGIAWLTAAVIYATGGLSGSPVLIPGTPVTLSLVLLATGYMWAPAIANAVTRAVTDEGWDNLRLSPQLRHGGRYWVAAWLLPVALTVVGSAAYFVVFPYHFDATLGTLSDAVAQTGAEPPFGPRVLVALQLVQAITLAPIINSAFTFGEEFGWRGYLLHKLLPLGERRAMAAMGVIWGVWHWPVIAMGHNYGTGYTGAPFLGMLAMVWFTFVVGTFLAWVALRGGSVWPAVIGHASVNGIAGIGILFVQGSPNPLLGPAPTGIVASVAWAALALWVLRKPERLRV